MGRHDNYSIQFSGLSTGTHHFDFDVEEAFFEQFKNDEIKNSHISVSVELQKHANMLELFFNIHGTLTVMCDICIDDVNIPITSREKLIVKFSEDTATQDEILTLPPGEHEINIAPYIYEFAVLALPAKRTHTANNCNKEMIKKINEHTKKASTHDTDPRWAALKNIKLN
jgi:uncharacterized metal-binding protein YceD (DUF177 family)